METFNEYHLDPKPFTFLNHLQENWQVIRDEFTYFRSKASQEELQFAYDIMGPKVKRLRPRAIQNTALLGCYFKEYLLKNTFKCIKLNILSMSYRMYQEKHLN